MNSSSRFINIYNTIDQVMRDFLGEDSRISHIHLIDKLSKKDNLFRFYKNDLKEFAELRNAIVHNTHFSGKPYGEVIAEPHEYVVEMYEELLTKITKPITAKDIYKRTDDISVYTASKDSIIIDIIESMYNKDYTCVPILENKKLIGVFSENVLLSYIALKRDYHFNKTRISDIIDLTDINKHQGEYFEFCKVNDTIFDIKELFNNKKKNHKRLEMIFVTGNGNRNEEILGVITAWDLL